MDSTDKLRRKLKRHYYFASLFQAWTEHYSRLTKIDCTFYDSEVTEGIVEEFSEELEDGLDTEELA